MLQSALVPAGVEAAEVATLTWVLVAGAAVIWLIVIGTTVYAIRFRPEAHSKRLAQGLILIGGIVFPTLVLAGVLFYGLRLLPDFRAPAHGPRIAVSGERFWWRVRYAADDEKKDWSATFIDTAKNGTTTANEIHLPVNERTEVLLYSPDVIHSFWIPALAGKIDMIPGRVNRLVLEPSKVGVYRGVCAEFCGTSHTRMAFDVIVSSRPDFDRWLAAQSRPARIDSARPGYRSFMANGCAACHAIRGSAAKGQVGPDLTHIGSRRSIGASLLVNNPQNLMRFIAAPDHLKPGIAMPGYDMLSPPELRAIAAWLWSLE